MITDYRKFRFSKLATREFEHLNYLFFWAVFGIIFWTIERFWIRDFYYPISCALDAQIPFCEYFLIPYLFWFVYIVGTLGYTLFFDIDGFKKFMQFIMISYSITIIIYILFPNCQELRPVQFERDNILTRCMAFFYSFDTNTNVCPSMHVTGSVAVSLCAWNSRHFEKPIWRILFSVVTILISVSTVFLKQHSVIDVIASLPVCLIAYIAVYKRKIRVLENA